MSRMPVLTSGELLVQRGEIPDPRGPGDRRDWAALAVVEVDDPDELSRAGEYWQAGYHGFLASGDVTALEEFEGEMIAGYPLVTDPDLVEDFAAATPGFDPGELYQP